MIMNKNKNNRFMPIIMAACVVVGIFLGSFFSNHFSGNRLNIINSGSNRLNNLLHIIDDQYVDAVNIDSLVDEAIPLILAELDPHSVYISAKRCGCSNRRPQRLILWSRCRICHQRRHHPYSECHPKRTCRKSRSFGW